MSSEARTKSERSLQIDLLKGLAILAVIALHTTPRALLHRTGAIFHIWQAVPLFLLLMGLNAARSFERRGRTTLAELYGGDYFRERFRRLVPPVLALAAVSLALGLAGLTSAQVDWRLALGRLPTPGPGNYFIGLLAQFVVLVPLIFYVSRRRPVVMLVGCVALDFTAQWLLLTQPIFDDKYLYAACLLRFVALIGLGIWLAGRSSLRGLRNLPIWIWAAGSVVHLVALLAPGTHFALFRAAAPHQTLLAAGYPVGLLAAGLWLLPDASERWVWRVLARIGQASYHIFLVQILFFAVGRPLARWNVGVASDSVVVNLSATAAAVLINGVVCVLLGIGLQSVQSRLLARVPGPDPG